MRIFLLYAYPLKDRFVSEHVSNEDARRVLNMAFMQESDTFSFKRHGPAVWGAYMLASYLSCVFSAVQTARWAGDLAYSLLPRKTTP